MERERIAEAVDARLQQLETCTYVKKLFVEAVPNKLFSQVAYKYRFPLSALRRLRHSSKPKPLLSPASAEIE
ncbi:hypothetical protein Dimus_033071 [Dionaea muscipula]